MASWRYPPPQSGHYTALTDKNQIYTSYISLLSDKANIYFGRISVQNNTYIKIRIEYLLHKRGRGMEKDLIRIEINRVMYVL